MSDDKLKQNTPVKVNLIGGFSINGVVKGVEMVHTPYLEGVGMSVVCKYIVEMEQPINGYSSACFDERQVEVV